MDYLPHTVVSSPMLVLLFCASLRYCFFISIILFARFSHVNWNSLNERKSLLVSSTFLNILTGSSRFFIRSVCRFSRPIKGVPIASTPVGFYQSHLNFPQHPSVFAWSKHLSIFLSLIFFFKSIIRVNGKTHSALSSCLLTQCLLLWEEMSDLRKSQFLGQILVYADTIYQHGKKSFLQKNEWINFPHTVEFRNVFLCQFPAFTHVINNFNSIIT